MHKRTMYVFLVLLVELFAFAIVAGVFMLGAYGIGALTHFFDLESDIIVLLSFVSMFIAITGVILFGVSSLIACFRAITDIVTDKTRAEKKAERWVMALGWWIPRKYRGPLVGDILEDCYQMREMGCGEWRICTQVLWQWAIGVLTLIPASIISAVWRILSQPK